MRRFQNIEQLFETGRRLMICLTYQKAALFSKDELRFVCQGPSCLEEKKVYVPRFREKAFILFLSFDKRERERKPINITYNSIKGKFFEEKHPLFFCLSNKKANSPTSS